MKKDLTCRLVIPQSPGDLSNVKHLIQSTIYKVEVKKQDNEEYTTCFVYETDNYSANRFNCERRIEKSVAFTSFSFENTSVEVRITCNLNVGSVKIRPLNFLVSHVTDDNVITFILESPKKISVEINDRINPLFIFTDIPDIPNTSATHYYGPGVHNIGQNMVIQSKESVYIAGGAVVQGSLRIADYASNVKISGRGILNMGTGQLEINDCTWLAENCTISAKANNNLQLEGLILTNATAWTISVTDSRGWDTREYTGLRGYKSYNNQYSNLKLISWNGNSDGIWFDGDNCIVDDCFIFNNDDCVTTHGSNNCKISNIVFWGGPWGRFFMHSHWASSSHLTFENINIIGKSLYPLFVAHCEDKGNQVYELKDFIFNNIRVEEHSCPVMVIDVVNTKISDWFFENITIDTKNVNEGYINCNKLGNINGLTFSNFKIGGITARSIEDMNIEKNKNVDTICFINK